MSTSERRPEAVVAETGERLSKGEMAGGAERKFLSEERGGMYSQTIGLARLALLNGEPEKALRYLNEGVAEVERRWRIACLADGHSEELVTRFLGPPLAYPIAETGAASATRASLAPSSTSLPLVSLPDPEQK